MMMEESQKSLADFENKEHSYHLSRDKTTCNMFQIYLTYMLYAIYSVMKIFLILLEEYTRFSLLVGHI